jgi:hypothetical protein
VKPYRPRPAPRVIVPDPDSEPPVYPWRSAPDHLATRSQLRARGLRPGRQGVQALLMWRSRRGGRPLIDGCRFAYLYDIRLARRVLPVTPRRAAALAVALAARQTCPQCGRRQAYVLSRRLGMCNPCAVILGAAA